MYAKAVVTCFVTTLILLGLSMKAYSSVSRVTAETDDGIVFTVWTDKTEIASGEEMAIHYKIRNVGTRTIYLVSEPTPSIYVEGGLINIGEPTPLWGHRTMFDYSYSEVKPKRSLDKSVTVPASKYQRSQLWDLTIGFLYVFDKRGLAKDAHQFTDETLIIGELAQRGVRVDVGTLGIWVH